MSITRSAWCNERLILGPKVPRSNLGRANCFPFSSPIITLVHINFPNFGNFFLLIHCWFDAMFDESSPCVVTAERLTLGPEVHGSKLARVNSVFPFGKAAIGIAK